MLNLGGGMDEAVASTVGKQNLYFIVSSTTVFLEQLPRPLHREREGNESSNKHISHISFLKKQTYFAQL